MTDNVVIDRRQQFYEKQIKHFTAKLEASERELTRIKKRDRLVRALATGEASDV